METPNFCNAPNCPIKAIETTVTESKARQEKFSDKLDSIILLLSEWRVIGANVENLKKSIDEFKENNRIAAEDNRDTHIKLYEKINKLEENKADKTESNRTIGWVWAIMILIANALVSFIIGYFTKKG